jgi:hypothetical protein
MRSYQFTNESPVADLAKKLPSLQKHDYDTIDTLVRQVSKRHRISSDQLHDLFVSKYGTAPHNWIKDRLGEEEQTGGALGLPFPGSYEQEYEPYKTKGRYHITAMTNEGIETDKEVQMVKDFINWSIKRLNIKRPYPHFHLSRDTAQAQKGHHTGLHTGDDNTIWVYIQNRNMIDIFRTIFHELVHEKQMQLGMIKPGDSYPGSPIEVMADMLAGKYIKIYGKKYPELFQ